MEESISESREKDCRYCANECNKNFSVCKCNSYLCNKCLAEEFKMTVNKEEGPHCTVCKTQYVATQKKCTCYSILTSCKYNTIMGCRTNFNITKGDTFGVSLALAWSVMLIFELSVNTSNINTSVNLDVLIVAMSILMDALSVSSEWYTNTTLLYLIIYTTKNIILIQFIHDGSVQMGLVILNSICSLYFLVIYVWVCKRVYGSNIRESENIIIKAK